MSIPDYSTEKNLNSAAVKAIRDINNEDAIDAGVMKAVFRYRDSILKATARVVVWGCIDGRLMLEKVDIISVVSVVSVVSVKGV